MCGKRPVSVRLSVFLSVRPSVCPSVRPVLSVRLSVCPVDRQRQPHADGLLLTGPIPTFLLRGCIDCILPYLTTVVNVSLRKGCVPIPRKMAVVTPLLKNASLDPQDLKNYSSHHEETMELPGERDNARNNARCTLARKTTHGLDGQHQDVDRTPRGRVSQNDRGQG